MTTNPCTRHSRRNCLDRGCRTTAASRRDGTSSGADLTDLVSPLNPASPTWVGTTTSAADSGTSSGGGSSSDSGASGPSCDSGAGGY